MVKGDYMILNDDSKGKIIYLYVKEKAEALKEIAEVSDDEIKLLGHVTEIKKQCESKLINLYKNYLVLEIDGESQKTDFISENIMLYAKIIKQEKAYECAVKVLGIRDQDNKITLVLSIPVIEKQVDRRRFFRIDVRTTIRYAILPFGKYKTILDIPKGAFLKTKKTFSIDVCAGGTKMIINEPCKKGDYLLLNIYIPNKMDILAKITRVEKTKNANQTLASVEFVYIHEKDRDQIVEFVIKNEIIKIRSTQKAN